MIFVLLLVLQFLLFASKLKDDTFSVNHYDVNYIINDNVI